MDSSRKVKLLFGFIGLMLAVIHLAAFFWFISHISLLAAMVSPATLWRLWVVIDFPVSLVVVVFSLEHEGMYRLLKLFVHGILGTIWWFFWPMITYKLLYRHNSR